jgi:uncharacterized protein (TIGR00251 family)
MIRELNGAIEIDCIISPRSSRNRIKGIRDGLLAIALCAPPVDGKANEALIQFLSELLGVPKSRIAITKGMASRRKTVIIQGITRQAAGSMLGITPLP